MTVIAKALELLSHFSATRPEIGLSQLCRLAKRDKATVYRHLTALEASGLIERNPATRAYRIGPAALHLAELREATVPRRASAMPALRALADSTGETAHISVLSGQALHKLVACESAAHSTRAVIDIQILPLHATASGLAALAFGPSDLRDVAAESLTRFTDQTAADLPALDRAIASARDSGIACSDRGFEDDIVGLATPVFDETGHLAGTLAVASVAARANGRARRRIIAQLISASRAITHAWGGTTPDMLETAWARHDAPSDQQETAL